MNAVSGDTNPFRYAGQYYDTETGTYYLRARYYNPAIGRFTQQDGWQYSDIINPLKLNLYTYCANNPIMYIDPSGHAWYHWAIGGLLVVGAGIAVVATAGGAAPAIAAVAMVVQGTAAATTATTVAAGAFVGSAAALGGAAIVAGMNSDSLDEFAEQGDWWTVASTAIGAGGGAVYGASVAVHSRKIQNIVRNNKQQADPLKIISDINFDNSQVGSKFGKHRYDYGIKSYHDYVTLAQRLFDSPEKIIFDSRVGEYYYIRGNDLLRLTKNGDFVSLYPGAKSSRVIDAIQAGGLLWEKK